MQMVAFSVHNTKHWKQKNRNSCEVRFSIKECFLPNSRKRYGILYSKCCFNLVNKI